MSSDRKALKITLSDGTVSYREIEEERTTLTEFDTQILSGIEYQWTSVLGKKHNSNFMVHDVL